MHHTFSRDEYKEFLIVRHLLQREFEDDYDYLDNLIYDSMCWDRSISGLNHLVSIILEQFEKIGIDTSKVIPFIYEFCQTHNFNIQEGELKFIDSLYSNDINVGLELEDELIIAENRLYAF